jgi:hypothetical protein
MERKETLNNCFLVIPAFTGMTGFFTANVFASGVAPESMRR